MKELEVFQLEQRIVPSDMMGTPPALSSPTQSTAPEIPLNTNDFISGLGLLTRRLTSYKSTVTISVTVTDYFSAQQRALALKQLIKDTAATLKQVQADLVDSGPFTGGIKAISYQRIVQGNHRTIIDALQELKLIEQKYPGSTNIQP